MNDPTLKLEEWEAQQKNESPNFDLGTIQSPVIEEVEVESHAGEEPKRGFGAMLARASEKLQGIGEESSLPKDKKSTRVNKNTREDFSVLVVSIVTLVITFWRVPEQIKPVKSEIDLFSDHLSGILLRHLPISNKLSADALDIIGLMAVTATWYSRVQPEVQAVREANKQGTPIYSPDNNNKHAGGIIQQIDPGTASWLNNAAQQTGGFAA